MSLFEAFLMQLADKSDQNVSIQSCVMLLCKSEGAAFPIGHLFLLADWLAENFLCYLSQACLNSSRINLREIGLGIYETLDVAEELHLGELLCKHINV